jgi:hypothetical protein
MIDFRPPNQSRRLRRASSPRPGLLAPLHVEARSLAQVEPTKVFMKRECSFRIISGTFDRGDRVSRSRGPARKTRVMSGLIGRLTTAHVLGIPALSGPQDTARTVVYVNAGAAARAGRTSAADAAKEGRAAPAQRADKVARTGDLERLGLVRTDEHSARECRWLVVAPQI